MTAGGRLLVVCAQREEARSRLTRYGARRTAGPKEEPRGWRSHLAGAEARVAVTGEGRRRARAAMLSLLEGRPAAVLVVGVAGALTEDLGAGDLLVAEGIHDESGGRIELEAPDLAALGRPWKSGEIVTVDEIVTRPERRRELALHIGSPVSAVVDMESYDYARAAQDEGVAVWVVRAVSDGADERLPDFLARHRRSDGSFSRGRIALAAAVRPASWKSLRRLERRVRTASDALADVVTAVARASG